MYGTLVKYSDGPGVSKAATQILLQTHFGRGDPLHARQISSGVRKDTHESRAAG